ncbi:hypothetical protein KYG_21694 [Acidovorax sp. NO-1]|nr:hypothetical protein KYG_21694 [Acidovorax sp. NO-1]
MRALMSRFASFPALQMMAAPSYPSGKLYQAQILKRHACTKLERKLYGVARTMMQRD